MTPYQKVSQRNRRLYALLETLSTKLNREEPEGHEYHQLIKQITTVKMEIEWNLNNLDIALARARDHATPVNIVSISRRRGTSGGSWLRVKNLESGKIYRSMGEAERDIGIRDGHCHNHVDRGKFYLDLPADHAVQL